MFKNPTRKGDFSERSEFIQRLEVIQEYKASLNQKDCTMPCPHCDIAPVFSVYEFSGEKWSSLYLHMVKEHNYIPDADFLAFVMNEQRTAVKKLFGHITDGPSTSFTPDTLEIILKEQGINTDLITEIMGTINAASLCAFNAGWDEAKELYKS